MPSQMVRKQFYIHKRQDALLKQLSQARGLSEAEIIRQAIEREAGMGSTAVRDSAAAWAEIMQFVQERERTLAGGGKPVQWNRQELYKEREERWFKSRGGK